MTPVRLNRLVTLETAVRAPDGAGGFTLVWQAMGELWAEITAQTGTEREAASATLASMPYRITVRAAPVGAPSRPRPDQRFRDETRIFRILAVVDADPTYRYLTCFTREEVVA